MGDDVNKQNAMKNQLVKANEKFKEFYDAEPSEMSKAASTQVFEYTFELAWKYIREIIKANEDDYFDSAKGIIKLAGKYNILTVEEVEKWIKYAEDRNLTVHMYRQDIADAIFNSLITFFEDVNKLIVSLDKYKNIEK